MDKKRIEIIGGGTISWVGPHLALAAPAYGSTARRLATLCAEMIPEMAVDLYLTKMANQGRGDASGWKAIETNQDVSDLIDELITDDTTKVIIMTAAMVDFGLQLDGPLGLEQGKFAQRLASNTSYPARLWGLEKIIPKIRKERKDIFLVGFKQTTGDEPDVQYIKGLELCKRASCNLVFANDTKTRLNMVISPEEARYHVTKDRDEALRGLVTMIKNRSHLTFTQSTVVEGESIPWDSPLVPESLRRIVNHCIERGAYRPFHGSTAGHFACKLDDQTFLTSQRKTDFNDLPRIGLVKVKTDGPDTVIAYGAKPSVGGQSQRIVFDDHPTLDCIVHFHCPIREGSEVPQVSQYEFECGSHECGRNTSKGLRQCEGEAFAVYLKEHGPNIAFNHNADPGPIIQFIEKNFDLDHKTGGFVSIEKVQLTHNTLETAQRVLDSPTPDLDSDIHCPIPKVGEI